MAYLVDGNNVMGQRPGWHRNRERARRDLLEQLAAFSRVKRARITVVFDGRPDKEFPEASAFRGVKVLYAEPGSDADTRIERLVEASADRRGLTVVTSDRRLLSTVRARGASTMRSGEFRALFEACLDGGQKVEDGETESVDDLDGWLRYFGSLPEDER